MYVDVLKRDAFFYLFYIFFYNIGVTKSSVYIFANIGRTNRLFCWALDIIIHLCSAVF